MNITQKKELLKEILTTSFVDDFKKYKKTIKLINNDLKKSDINFQYSYDNFCIDFLNETLKNIQHIDIFNSDEYEQFYINLWQFNFYNLKCMINKKLDDLGYENSNFFEQSNIRKNINKKYLN